MILRIATTSRAEKRAYLQAIRKRYICAVCRYNRKYAIRILNKNAMKRRAKPGRKPCASGTKSCRQKTAQALKEMSLQELRQVHQMSQERLAELLYILSKQMFLTLNDERN